MSEYINIAGVDYITSRDKIKEIALSCGFDSSSFKSYNVNGRFRKGYIKAIFNHSFKCFADKLRASRKVKEELNKLEVV